MDSTFINQMKTLKQEINYAESAFLRYDIYSSEEKSTAYEILVLYAYFFIKKHKQYSKCRKHTVSSHALKYGEEYSKKAVDIFYAITIRSAKMIYAKSSEYKNLDMKTKLAYFYLMDDAIVKLRDIYNENYHYKVCTIGMTSNRVRSVLKTERSDRVWLKDLDISYLEDTLRKKVDFALSRKPKTANSESLLDFKSLRSTAIITEMLYDVDQAFKLNELLDIRVMKDSVSLLVEYLSHSKLLFSECLINRYSHNENLQVKADYVTYIYQLISLIEFIDHNYCEVYDNNIYDCYHMLNDHESDFLNLLYSRKYLLKKSM